MRNPPFRTAPVRPHEGDRCLGDQLAAIFLPIHADQYTGPALSPNR